MSDSFLDGLTWKIQLLNLFENCKNTSSFVSDPRKLVCLSEMYVRVFPSNYVKPNHVVLCRMVRGIQILKPRRKIRTLTHSKLKP